MLKLQEHCSYTSFVNAATPRNKRNYTKTLLLSDKNGKMSAVSNSFQTNFQNVNKNSLRNKIFERRRQNGAPFFQLLWKGNFEMRFAVGVVWIFCGYVGDVVVRVFGGDGGYHEYYLVTKMSRILLHLTGV